MVLSMLVAGQIVGPVGRLAEAAERVRTGIKSRQERSEVRGFFSSCETSAAKFSIASRRR
jgi:nitrogen fixation/metabolism regulation signal transduction histidine kinase